MWQGLMELDGNILLYVQDNLRTDILDSIAVPFTSLGNAGLVWILIVAMLVMYRNTRKDGLYCVVSLIMCFIVVNLFLKNVIARIRPYDAMEQIRCLVEPQMDYSFPSGHTAIAFAASVPVFILSSKRLGVVMLIFSVLMGLSRIYVCVHYPTDVIGGAVIGILCGLVTGLVIYPRFERHNKKNSKKMKKRVDRINRR